jgi:hypothetical protein
MAGRGLYYITPEVACGACDGRVVGHSLKAPAISAVLRLNDWRSGVGGGGHGGRARGRNGRCQDPERDHDGGVVHAKAEMDPRSGTA